MCKGHQGGSIIQQHGTWAGSQYEGLISNTNVQLLNENTHLSVEYDSELQAEENPMLESTFNQRNVCVEKSREAWMQIVKMASQSDSIAHSTLAVINRSLHDLRVQEQCQLESGKDRITNADMFIRPSGLTLRRRLRIVDKYHGAKRSHSILKNYLKKKRCVIETRKSLVSDLHMH